MVTDEMAENSEAEGDENAEDYLAMSTRSSSTVSSILTPTSTRSRSSALSSTPEANLQESTSYSEEVDEDQNDVVGMEEIELQNIR
jgi:hypothetical protein